MHSQSSFLRKEAGVLCPAKIPLSAPLLRHRHASVLQATHDGDLRISLLGMSENSSTGFAGSALISLEIRVNDYAGLSRMIRNDYAGRVVDIVDLLHKGSNYEAPRFQLHMSHFNNQRPDPV